MFEALAVHPSVTFLLKIFPLRTEFVVESTISTDEGSQEVINYFIPTTNG